MQKQRLYNKTLIIASATEYDLPYEHAPLHTLEPIYEALFQGGHIQSRLQSKLGSSSFEPGMSSTQSLSIETVCT